MARPAGFDRSKALNNALTLFGRKGCQATSLAGLLAAMGIGRSSFRAAFTGNRSVCVSGMDLFAARVMKMLDHDRGKDRRGMCCRASSRVTWRAPAERVPTGGACW